MPARMISNGCEGAQPQLETGRGRAECQGLVARAEAHRESFGQPFTTHAMLCRAHAKALGYVHPAGRE